MGRRHLLTRGAPAALALALVASLAVFAACSPGEDVGYAPLSADGGASEEASARDAGRIVRESGVEGGAVETSSPLPPATPIPCSGGCDTTAGLGCCIDSASASCVEQVHYYRGATSPTPFCQSAAGNDTFVACLASDADNTCCWGKDGPNGTWNARYRASCAGGFEACDPSADGGACANGGTCRAKTCKGLLVGSCSPTEDAPCSP